MIAFGKTVSKVMRLPNGGGVMAQQSNLIILTYRFENPGLSNRKTWVYQKKKK